MKQLHAGEVGPHDGHGGVDDLFVERLGLVLLNELRADLMELLRGGEFRHQLPLSFEQRLAGLHSFQAEAELAGNNDSKVDLGVGERTRRIAVRHELANEIAFCKKRNERERADAFCLDRRFESVIEIGAVDILDADQLRFFRIPGPRRVAVHGPAIAVRQAAPGDEPHGARIVEQEDRGALAPQSFADRVQCGIARIAARPGTKQSVGKPK